MSTMMIGAAAMILVASISSAIMFGCFRRVESLVLVLCGPFISAPVCIYFDLGFWETVLATGAGVTLVNALIFLTIWLGERSAIAGNRT